MKDNHNQKTITDAFNGLTEEELQEMRDDLEAQANKPNRHNPVSKLLEVQKLVTKITEGSNRVFVDLDSDDPKNIVRFERGGKLFYVEFNHREGTFNVKELDPPASKPKKLSQLLNKRRVIGVDIEPEDSASNHDTMSQ